MSLDNLIKDKGGDLDKERERGECPKCESRGEQVSEIEWKCTTQYNKCSVLHWFSWQTELVDIDE